MPANALARHASNSSSAKSPWDPRLQEYMLRVAPAEDRQQRRFIGSFPLVRSGGGSLSKPLLSCLMARSAAAVRLVEATGETAKAAKTGWPWHTGTPSCKSVISVTNDGAGAAGLPGEKGGQVGDGTGGGPRRCNGHAARPSRKVHFACFMHVLRARSLRLSPCT